MYMTNPIRPNIASLKTIIITKQLPFPLHNYAHRPLYMHAMVGRDKIIVIADSVSWYRNLIQRAIARIFIKSTLHGY